MLGEQATADQEERIVIDLATHMLPKLPDIENGQRGRAGPVILNPLAEVEVGVLVPVMVRCRELVVHAQRHAERGHHQHRYKRGKGDQDAGSQPGLDQQGRTLSSKLPSLYHRVFDRVNLQRNPCSRRRLWEFVVRVGPADGAHDGFRPNGDFSHRWVTIESSILEARVHSMMSRDGEEACAQSDLP